ncbi:MAG: molybdenum cofactor biosynthesis protein MoaE [bacterium]|nr:molybdenum cofactor biosynthesis protein MoaE [bacterium]MCY4256829.1 molybdenum cofactor biosynthesis protein MoaE [bacterium]
MQPPEQPPDTAQVWTGISAAPLPVEQVLGWVGRNDCGGVVLFSGTARNHSEGRPEVSVLQYEAYEAHVVPRLEALAAQARARWPELGRLALLHRTGAVEIGESAVVVAASSPHREEAFAAARFCIDQLKSTVPIWKKETWQGGQSWGLEAQHISSVEDSSVGDPAAGNPVEGDLGLADNDAMR